MRKELFTWSLMEQAPLSEIVGAFTEMIDYDQVPYMYLPDTGGGYYACIVSEEVLSPEEIKQILANGDGE